MQRADWCMQHLMSENVYDRTEFRDAVLLHALGLIAKRSASNYTSGTGAT
jgi:hypothetical protein